MFLTGDHNLGYGTAGNPPTVAQIFTGAQAFQVIGTNPTTLANLSWADNMHQKQGNVGLADGSVQGFSPSKLREALRNSGDTGSTQIRGFQAGANRLQFP
jgi:prepilin-type processing-associated H-X9-DG protein